MSFPESPIDTKPFMREQGRGYPEFDYAAAWREVRPMWDALSPRVRDLFARVHVECAGIYQDHRLDMPWPDGGDLQRAFLEVPEDELRKAASVIHALGHWMPGPEERGFARDADPDRRLFSGQPQDGAYWKFAHYADQSIRERQGKPWAGREPSPPSSLALVCKRLGITIDNTYGAPTSQDDDADDWKRTATGWTCKLAMGQRRMTVPFWQGAAHEKEPTPWDVLYCLVSDAQGVEEAFEDWAATFGYDSDSRKAKRTYDQCVKLGTKVRRFLGDHFEDVAQAACES